jgi:F-type H+-transporting ATPase subunit epsilon
MAAIPASIRLEIVTPEKMLVREDVDEVVVPGEEGYLGVLPGHTPLLATLKGGDLWYRKGQEKTHVDIAGGFVEVLPDRVTILAEAGAPAAHTS